MSVLIIRWFIKRPVLALTEQTKNGHAFIDDISLLIQHRRFPRKPETVSEFWAVKYFFNEVIIRIKLHCAAGGHLLPQIKCSFYQAGFWNHRPPIIKCTFGTFVRNVCRALCRAAAKSLAYL